MAINNKRERNDGGLLLATALISLHYKEAFFVSIYEDKYLKFLSWS